ncbi:MAG TPA: condensation domain-containing protein, partial [Thermoanaerobaculia bacterium]|nr:condensation domain-containing protein [Thermoanaerobaculia bacterium]
QALARVWSLVLGLPRVGARESFFELGGDSILAMQVVSRARQAGLLLTPQDLFRHPTIAELAAVAGAASAAVPGQGPVQGPVPLTPIQRWFFEQVTADPHHYNQALLLEVDPQVEPRLLERAWDLLVAHHDALRLRFVQEDGGWRQHNAAAEESTVFCRIDLSRLPAGLQGAAVQEAAPALQASLDLARGPLLRVALFERRENRPHLLLVIVHHLAVDGVSWRILLEDLQSLCGGEPGLAAKTTSFQQWAGLLRQQAVPAVEAAYWQEVTSRPAGRLPLDLAGDSNTWGSLDQVTVSLAARETRTLLQEALLAALAQVLHRWTGHAELLLDLEAHGREAPDGVDLTRTVGWFTSLFPVRLDLRGATLETVKEQLRAVPRGGVGYGLLRADCRPEMSFNYLGRFDTGPRFRLSEAGVGPTRSPRARRAHLLEIDSGVSEDRLVIVWSYSRELHRRSTIEALAAEHAAALRVLIEHGQNELDELYRTYPDLEDVYPLSPMQAGLLFHSLRTEGAQEYFEQLVFTLDGEVRAAELARAWQEMVDRHGVLRTSFLVDRNGGEPLQLLHRHAELPFRTLDWQGLPGDERRERLERFLEEDRRQGFDLSAPPLTRLTWIRLGPRRCWLVWSHHHLVLDGWSVSQLFAEVSAVYEGRTAPAVRRPYRDYIDWLRRQDLAAAEELWRRELAGFTEPTPLTALAEGTGESAVWELEALDLSARLDAGLRELSRRRRWTLSTLVAGAWSLLLGRHSGRPEVVFGVTLAGRPA